MLPPKAVSTTVLPFLKRESEPGAPISHTLAPVSVTAKGVGSRVKDTVMIARLSAELHNYYCFGGYYLGWS